METKVNLFSVPWTRKLFPPHIEWCIGKYPGLCPIFFKTNAWYLKFMLYHAVI